MKKAQDLPPVTGTVLSQQSEIKLHLDDEQAYKNLQTHNNALIDHVQKFCQ